jgi:surface antigen
MTVIVGAVAFLSQALPSVATAQPASRAKPARMSPRTPEPPPAAFVDEQSTWEQSAQTLAEAEMPVTEGVLQCVPYARFLSGIPLHGDAWTWWDQAAGLFARGNHPEPGAILSFPGIDRMPLGHIAVVTQVLSARKILIDHANWPNAFVQHGAISRDITVEDVSDANDWSEVRVQFGEGGPMGSVYPVNGFIYGWSETGVPVASPRLPLDYALWAPAVPTLRAFSATNFIWALPPAERKKALAAASDVAVKIQAVALAGKPRRPSAMVNEASLGRSDGPAARVLGVTALGHGLDGRTFYQINGLISR